MRVPPSSLEKSTFLKITSRLNVCLFQLKIESFCDTLIMRLFIIQAKAGNIVGIYPGTVYQPYQPILIQSIRNPFLFRCADGVLIDGKDCGISRTIYRSCSPRDQIGKYTNVKPYKSFDKSNRMCVCVCLDQGNRYDSPLQCVMYLLIGPWKVFNYFWGRLTPPS